MYRYVENKIVSLGIPLTIILLLLTQFSMSDPRLWWILIVIAHLLGYVHFILGYYYQHQAVVARGDTRERCWLYVFTGIAIAVSLAFIIADQLSLLAVVAILYFIVHGVLNESVMIERQAERSVDRKTFSAFIPYICLFFILSLTHPSFFFTPSLEFLNPDPATAQLWLGSIIPITALTVTTLALVTVFVWLLSIRLLRQRQWIVALTASSLGISTIIAAYLQQPLHYVLLYFVFLSFHFISWSYYYWQVYKEHKPEKVPAYIRHHAYILLPFGVLSLLAFASNDLAQDLHTFFFNGAIFITLAMIHNTTSLLNESWVKKHLLQRS